MADGSVFSGDNNVFDLAWQAYIEGQLDLPPGAGPVIRFHRGLRNQSAGMDVAKAMFPHPSRITVAGSSADGVGAVEAGQKRRRRLHPVTSVSSSPATPRTRRSRRPCSTSRTRTACP